VIIRGALHGIRRREFRDQEKRVSRSGVDIPGIRRRKPWIQDA
jgi:hypothetical protein